MRLDYFMALKVMELVRSGKFTKDRETETVINGNIDYHKADIASFTTGGEIFISSADVYDGLSLLATRLVIDIQKELVMNNPLWKCSYKNNSKTRAALAELKRNNIVERIPNTDLYLVNPIKIRKGTPLAIYGALYTYAERMLKDNPKWKPTNEDIFRLAKPKGLSLHILGSVDLD
jgi:hypothetical protein